ncbi:MAG: asparagine synthase (glutamine-hydrolyzing) [Acidobacteriota bacterium]
MCGLAGILRLDGGPLEAPERAAKMASALVHRGPDGDGFFADGPVALAFRRLAIIDLETGDQPMANEDGAVRVVFNGEIYDHAALRAELESRGHQFRSRADTEVIVHGWEEWGEGVLERLRGMFALAVWDGRARRLLLARDRLGQKPLFWGVDAARRELAFASELGALQRWPGLERRLDLDALDDYLTFLYVPHPRSALAGAHQLAPAHRLLVDLRATERESMPTPRRWWYPPAPSSAPSGLHGSSHRQHADALRARLDEAVRLRLRSDVPVGVFLSSGVDSTIVAALAARHDDDLDAFTLGFDDPRFDETEAARETVGRLGLHHHVESLDAGSFAADELPALVERMDQPFGDSSFLPTYWLSRLARRRVTVALSGDGGDELFCGYARYRNFHLLCRLGRLPDAYLALGARGAAGLARLLRPLAGDDGLGVLAGGLAERARQVAKATSLAALPESRRILALLTYFDHADKERLLRPDVRARVTGTSLETLEAQLAAADDIAAHAADGRPLEPLERFLLRDLATSFVDDALVKVDRASMACSLEVRSPLLDHHVVELALSMPAVEKLAARGGRSKAVLKRAAADLVPPREAERPKRGFEVPFARWFQRPDWRALLVDALSEERLRRQGIFEPSAVLDLRDRLLDDPEARRQPLSAYQLRHRVWALLVFQIWAERRLGAAG